MSGLPPVHAALGALLPTPTPTPTLAPFTDVVYVANAVPWGDLSLDGKSTPLPLPGNGGLPLILARGEHALVYRADPFPTLRCRLNVPQARSDTCPLITDENVRSALLGSDSGGSRLIDLQDTPHRLPPDQQAALQQQVVAALATPETTTVAAGDYYVAHGGAVAIARQPLAAMLIYTLQDAPTAQVLIAQPWGPEISSCASLCALPPGMGSFCSPPAPRGRSWRMCR